MNKEVTVHEEDRFAHIMIAAYAKQLSRGDKDRLMMLAREMAERNDQFNEASFSSDFIFFQQICEMFGSERSSVRTMALHKLMGG